MKVIRLRRRLVEYRGITFRADLVEQVFLHRPAVNSDTPEVVVVLTTGRTVKFWEEESTDGVLGAIRGGA